MTKNKTKDKTIDTKYFKASVKFVRVSPYKLRKVANEVRGMHASLALKKLAIMTQKSAGIMYKLIHSCVSNATHNFEQNEASLVIATVLVNEGKKIKRSKPRARGRMDAITKPTAHVDISLINKGVA
jgi:large subunit ribosomal protein L22